MDRNLLVGFGGGSGRCASSELCELTLALDGLSLVALVSCGACDSTLAYFSRMKRSMAESASSASIGIGGRLFLGLY